MLGVIIVNVGERIKMRRKRLNMSAEELATKIGKSPATMYRYEKGEIDKMDASVLLPIADALSTTPAYLMGWENGLEAVTTTKRIPILGDTAAGQPIIANREYEEYIDVPTDGRKFDAAVRVTGDSMMPNYRIGDLALVRYQDDVLDGQIAVVCLDDEVTLKRIYHMPNGIVLHSDNPKYKPVMISEDDVPNIHLTGRAIGCIRWEE